jgi:exonuclease III
VRSKIENDDILQLLTTFDVIWLSELKTDSDVHIPGFKTYRNKERYSNHGGIGLFIKYSLADDVENVQFCGDDAVLVTFKTIPDVVFSGWYVAPSDSRYATNDVFASMSAKLSEDRNVVMLGDFNAKIKDRNAVLDHPAYAYNNDNHPHNNYGDILECITRDNKLVLLNGLKYDNKLFDDSLTYRMRNEWKSRLDLMICSQSLLESIDHFKILQGDCKLPSDHAIITSQLTVQYRVNMLDIYRRAILLNEYEVPISPGRRGIKMDQIDELTFVENLMKLTPPEVSTDNLDECIKFLGDGMYSCAEMSLIPPKEWDLSKSRWRRLLESENPKDIWYAINWKGELGQKENKEAPKPEEFKLHFEKLLLTDSTDDVDSVDTSSSPNIPVLDDPISRGELIENVFDLKSNKACDRNGNSPGFIKQLPLVLLLFILNLFNTIFSSSTIPIEWTISKLITLFKKGKTSLCGNYRGIAINEILFRLFDQIIGRRLSLWYKAFKEQAGGQKLRDCIEHILTVRLLIDYARKTRKKLYILFIDFEKAYDKVERAKLFELLKTAGCGRVMLEVLKAIYKNTKFLFKMVVILANMGVKQGSSASSLLFIVYVDKMIKMVKAFENDGFLGALHILMLMDDTILFATTKENLVKKFQICQDYCAEYGMSINQSKTKFMVINGKGDDFETIESRGIKVKYCKSYIYLGAPITDDGSYRTMINLHVKEKMKHAIKFYTFLNRNPDAPFSIKKRVAKACVFTSIIYGSETWLTDNYGKTETLYNKIVKALLDVRQTTCTDLCLIEADMPSFASLVQERMRKYLQKKLPNLEADHPLQVALELNRSVDTKSYRRINELLTEEANLVERDCELRAESVRQSSSTKRMQYCKMNPELESPAFYKNGDIQEFQRKEVTRFRLSSHNLKVETGRWGRVDRESRTCTCEVGGVQDEEHVTTVCGLTTGPRGKYGIEHQQLKDLFSEVEDERLCPFFYELSKIFEKS